MGKYSLIYITNNEGIAWYLLWILKKQQFTQVIDHISLNIKETESLVIIQSKLKVIFQSERKKLEGEIKLSRKGL